MQKTIEAARGRPVPDEPVQKPPRAPAGRLTFIPPMLPTLVEKPPTGDGWIHEVKFDGYRTQLVIDAGGVRAFTRRGHDWTDKYRPIVDEAARLPANSAIIDGEMIVPNAAGLSDFHSFRKAIAGVAGQPGLRRLRPAAPRRRGPARPAAGRAQGQARELIAGGRQRHPVQRALRRRAAATSITASRGWGWRAWCRSGRTAPIAAAGPRAWLKAKCYEDQPSSRSRRCCASAASRPSPTWSTAKAGMSAAPSSR